MSFTHLHVHSEYSLLDGAARIRDLVAEAARFGMKSLALTDHGTMFGVVEFYKECKKQGIKPIIGCEVYVARGSIEVQEKSPNHLILLVKNEEGYKNLIKLVSIANKEGFYYKPRIDENLMERFSKGLIALSACPAGRIPELILEGNYEEAKKTAIKYRDIYGEGNFYLEIQNHGLDKEQIINRELTKMSEETGIKLVATNDSHYVKKEDAKMHDVLLCIKTGARLSDEVRMKFPSDDFYLKSEDEMRMLFPGQTKAIENTLEVAEKCNFDFDFNSQHLPDFEVPEGETKEGYLRKLCCEGLEKRYKNVTNELRERLEFELDTIHNMGYDEYFLIVHDFIHYAKTRGIPVGPGRGSAAGSLVSYCLDITCVDPIKYNLLFERFLNPERVSMPDIDIDFCKDRRQEVIDYVIDKYGDDRVAQIVTFGTLKAKAAIRDVGRIMNAGYGEVDRLAKAVPPGLGVTLSDALKDSNFKELYEEGEDSKEVVDMALQLEGMVRNAGTHAAGVVISKESIDSYVPIYKSDKGFCTQMTMTTIEELGLLKMDFLGLKNLTVIENCKNMVYRNHGIKINFDDSNYDDSKVYELISSGNTEGIFQLESEGMTEFMKDLKPDSIEDIIAGISLYRPGPMDSKDNYIFNKRHPDRIKYKHPALKPILSLTYGCLVYQEQVMQIVRELAGYSYGRADLVRRAMSKKKADEMAKEREIFLFGTENEYWAEENEKSCKISDAPVTDDEEVVEGCVKRGIPKEIGNEIFDEMESFASYAFNKSHAAAYAVISYQTAYLKAHYPVEFMASLLASASGNDGKMARYIKNARDMNIEILPPDVNKSGVTFEARGNEILFGLADVKNVGDSAADHIVKVRENRGVIYNNLYAFVQDMDISKVNKSVLENLIRAGAFRDFEGTMAANLSIYNDALEQKKKSNKGITADQMSLFDEGQIEGEQFSQEIPKISEFKESQKMKFEKEALGMYLTTHPMKEHEQYLKGKITDNLGNINLGLNREESEASEEAVVVKSSKYREGQRVVLAGLIPAIKTIVTKKGQMMAFAKLEDMTGSIEMVIFPSVYEKYRRILDEDVVIIAEGKLSSKDGVEYNLLVDKMRLLEKGIEEERIVKLRITEDLNSKEANKKIEFLKSLESEGTEIMKILIYIEGRAYKMNIKGVSLTTEMENDFKNIFGEENVKVVRAGEDA